jgi:anti-sigma factor RsiW
MSHVGSETLAAYWLGDLSEADVLLLEDHIFGCALCTAASARMAALPRALAFAVRPIVTTSDGARLLSLDPRARRVVVAPGGRAVVDFSGGAEAQLVAFESDLRGVNQVDVTMYTRDGTALVESTNVPFDTEAGTITIACRSHYLKGGQFPLEVTIGVEATADGLRRSLGSFDIDHIPSV